MCIFVDDKKWSCEDMTSPAAPLHYTAVDIAFGEGLAQVSPVYTRVLMTQV